MVIEKYLMQKGVSCKTKGFNYLVKAIELVRENEKYKSSGKKELLVDIANYFEISVASLHRAISYTLKTSNITFSVLEFIFIAEIETR